MIELTISVDDVVLEAALDRAAKENTTLDAVCANALETYLSYSRDHDDKELKD